MVPASADIAKFAAEALGRDPQERGTAKLASALAKQPVEPYKPSGLLDTDRAAAECVATIRAELHEDPTVCVYVSRLCGTTTNGVEFTWRVAIYGKADKTHEHASLGRAAMLAVNGYRLALQSKQYMAEFEARFQDTTEPDQSERTRRATEAKFGGAS